MLLVLTLRKNWTVNGGRKSQLLSLNIWNQQSDHVECECSMGHGWVTDFSGSMGAMIRHMHCQMGGAISWWLNHPSWPMPGRHGYDKPSNHRNRNPKSKIQFSLFVKTPFLWSQRCVNAIHHGFYWVLLCSQFFTVKAIVPLTASGVHGHGKCQRNWLKGTRLVLSCFDTSKTHKIHWHLTFPIISMGHGFFNIQFLSNRPQKHSFG